MRCILVDGVGNWVGYEAKSDKTIIVNVPSPRGGIVAFERTGETVGDGLPVFRQEGCGRPELRGESRLDAQGS
jgi:hypothetical protein